MLKQLLFAALLFGPSAEVSAQTTASTSDQDLAAQLSNPVADLTVVPLQYNYDDGYLDGSAAKSYVNIMPVIPISISDDWNMISRTILPVVNLDGFQGDGSDKTGLGNTIQSFFFSPKAPTSGGLIWGVGPVVQIPTATNDISPNQWGLGVTALALKQSNGWTFGALANHIWSVSDNDEFGKTSNTFVQPFLAYATKTAVSYSLNTEATYDWVSDEWSVPINFTVGKIVKFDKQLVQISGGVRYWADSPDDGPQGWGGRIMLTYMFPKKG